MTASQTQAGRQAGRDWCSKPTWTIIVAVPVCVRASLLDGADRQVRLRIGHGKPASGDDPALPRHRCWCHTSCQYQASYCNTPHQRSVHTLLAGLKHLHECQAWSSLLYLLPCTSNLTCNFTPHGAMSRSHSKVQHKARLVSLWGIEHARVTAHSTQHTDAHDGVYAGADRGVGQLMSNATLCRGDRTHSRWWLPRLSMYGRLAARG